MSAADAVRVCANCYDYAGEHSLLVWSNDGYVHKVDYEDPQRCPGQEDDQTDDRAQPMMLSRADAIYFDIVPS